MSNINFAELMPLITALSENPAAMNLISSLMSNNAAPQSPPNPPPQSTPDSSDMLAKLMGMMGGAQKTESAAPNSSVSSVFGSKEEMKNRMVLLNAVRPYLSAERQGRLEMVIKLLRLAELGALGSLLGGS